jgi:hypothetical protein
VSAVYLHCQVLPGIFSTEYYVLVNGSSAYYISTKNVNLRGTLNPDKPIDGLVRAYVVQEQGDKVLVQLPGEAVVGGVRTWVERRAIQAA